MKTNKFVLSSVALASMTLASGLASTPAMASSQSGYTMAATHMYLDEQNISNPEHLVATDPWSGSETTWIPIYYLQQALKSVGFQTSWNGTDLTFTKYPANWKFNVALGNQEANPIVAPQGQMQISLVNGAPPSMNFPKLVAKDPSSGVNTTYVPIYYLNTVLTHDFSMGSTWDGVNWDLTVQGYNPISTKSYSTSAGAADHIASLQTVNTYLAFGENSPTLNLGLGISARGDAGMGHAGYLWHEGNWTIEILFYTMNAGVKQVAENMVSYLHTHMLPAPNNHGVIIVNSTNANTTSFKPKTIIAWQEGTMVNELQQTGDPVQALQTVVNHK